VVERDEEHGHGSEALEVVTVRKRENGSPSVVQMLQCSSGLDPK